MVALHINFIETWGSPCSCLQCIFALFYAFSSSTLNRRGSASAITPFAGGVPSNVLVAKEQIKQLGVELLMAFVQIGG